MALSIRSSFVKSVSRNKSHAPPKGSPTPKSQAVYTDDQVSGRILEVLIQAEEYVVLITPYLSLSDHLRNEILTTINRGVSIEIVIRQDEVSQDLEQLSWLLNAGVEVYSEEYLHAKLYLNEHSIVVSSMNLTANSSSKSKDIAIIIQNSQDQSDIRSYVETLVEFANPVVTDADQGTHDSFMGLCIRCGSPLSFEPGKPLCNDCFASWVNHPDPHHEESYCHACGTDEWEVTVANPLCGPCYNLTRNYPPVASP